MALVQGTDGAGFSSGSSTKVDWVRLNELATEVNNYSKIDISNKIKEIQELKKGVIWEGQDKEKVMKEYDELMQDFESLVSMISKYGAFLMGVADTYQNASKKIQDIMN